MVEDSFEEQFGIPFDTVIDVNELGLGSSDNNICSFMDLKTKNVYSYDIEAGMWLEKNKYQAEYLAEFNNLYKSVNN